MLVLFMFLIELLGKISHFAQNRKSVLIEINDFLIVHFSKVNY